MNDLIQELHSLSNANMASLPNGWTLIKTCYACPEQYDLLDADNNMRAYFRLRHGCFTVNCPDVRGTLVYESAESEGDGIFEDTERAVFMTRALMAVEAYYAKEASN